MPPLLPMANDWLLPPSSSITSGLSRIAGNPSSVTKDGSYRSPPSNHIGKIRTQPAVRLCDKAKLNFELKIRYFVYICLLFIEPRPLRFLLTAGR